MATNLIEGFLNMFSRKSNLTLLPGTTYHWINAGGGNYFILKRVADQELGFIVSLTNVGRLPEPQFQNLCSDFCQLLNEKSNAQVSQDNVVSLNLKKDINHEKPL